MSRNPTKDKLMAKLDAMENYARTQKGAPYLMEQSPISVIWWEGYLSALQSVIRANIASFCEFKVNEFAGKGKVLN